MMYIDNVRGNHLSSSSRNGQMIITFPSLYYPGFTVTATSTNEVSHNQTVWEMKIGDSVGDPAIYDKVFLEDVIQEIML